MLAARRERQLMDHVFVALGDGAEDSVQSVAC